MFHASPAATARTTVVSASDKNEPPACGARLPHPIAHGYLVHQLSLLMVSLPATHQRPYVTPRLELHPSTFALICTMILTTSPILNSHSLKPLPLVVATFFQSNHERSIITRKDEVP